MTDLVDRLHEEGLGFGIGPALLCQEAEAEILCLRARNAELVEALDGALLWTDEERDVSDWRPKANTAIARAKETP